MKNVYRVNVENNTKPEKPELDAKMAQKPYVAVVGGINIDIGGRPYHKLIPHDSNPGTVSISLGGVGRNIAHNLRLLDIPVCFFTAFGDDVHACTIEKNCEALDIDIRYARKIPGANSPTYLFVSREDGNMEIAVSDMAVCDYITPEYIAQYMDVINQAGALVMDTNIPAETIGYLAEHCTVPIFADPVSVTKAEKLRPYLSRIHTLKPNKLEAGELTGIQISGPVSCTQAARRLLELGVKRVFLSLGEDGVLAAEEGFQRSYPCFPAKQQNATGAGDAFMAGLVWSYINAKEMDETARIASAAAAVAVESEQTINPLLSLEQIRRRYRV